MASRQFYGIRSATKVDALCYAAAHSKLKEMKLLLSDGLDINAVSRCHGGTALNSAVSSRSIKSVKFLIATGAKLNLINEIGLTPLMIACSLGKSKGTQIAIMLIEAGADVKYVRRSDEMTALKFAVGSCPAKVIQKLIDQGAEVDGPHRTKQTALMLAARENDVDAIRILIKNGADISRTCKLKWAEGRTAEGLAELEKRRSALAYFRSLHVS